MKEIFCSKKKIAIDQKNFLDRFIQIFLENIYGISMNKQIPENEENNPHIRSADYFNINLSPVWMEAHTHKKNVVVVVLFLSLSLFPFVHFCRSM